MSEQELCSAPVQQTPPPAPPAPRPMRRVGTTTMGLVLVVAGIAITAGMLNPDLDFSLLCKLSPLVLVALGVEVLIAACTARQAKLKYDVLSMFVCAFLIIAALCGTAAAPMLEYVGPARQKAVRQLEDQWTDQVLDSLRGQENVLDVSCWLYADDWSTTAEIRRDGFDVVSNAHIHVTLLGDYADEASFAEACAPVVEALRDTSVEAPTLEIHWNGAGTFFDLYLDTPFAWEQTDLTPYVSGGNFEQAG